MKDNKQGCRLKAKNITIGYKELPVSSNINVEIPDHSFTVIIGPNGCGKSTLLKGLSRLVKPFSGDVLLDEKSITSYTSKEVAKILGLLPQSATAPSGILVRDLIARGRFPHQTFFRQWSTKDVLAIDEAIEATGLTSLLDHSVDELSGGQRQRVWITMVLAQQTPYLLLDEPTTYLDITHQMELMDLCYELYREKGRTIVAVLHDINQACRYATHIIAMESGKIIATGSPKNVITKANIKRIFGLESIIIDDPISKTPLVIPKSYHLQSV